MVRLWRGAAFTLAGVLDSQLAPYVDRAGRADDLFRECLSQAARTDVANQQVWAHVRVHQRLRAWLTARAQWRGLELCIEFFRLNGPIPVPTVFDGRVYAELPSLPGLEEIPRELLGLPRRQIAVGVHCARQMARRRPWYWMATPFIRGVDLTGGHAVD